MSDSRPPPRRTRALARLETFTAIGVVAVLALLLAMVAFSRPTQAMEQRTVDYRQSASFSYTGETASDSIYGISGLETGETVVLDDVDRLRMQVAYSLESASEARVEGTAELNAVVAVTGGLRRTFPISEASVDGPRVVLEGVLPLRNMLTYLQRSRGLLGDVGVGATATVTLASSVEVAGTLDDRALAATFAPTLDLVLTDDTLAVASDGTEAVEADAEVLNPAESGEVAYQATVPATIPLLVADPRVDVLRWWSLGVLLVCLVALVVLGRRLFRRGGADEAAHILGLHGSRVVSVSRLDLRGGPVADVASFEDLHELARRYESVIMHVADADGDVFTLWDTGLTYRYRAAPHVSEPASAPEPWTSSAAEGRSRSVDRTDRLLVGRGAESI